LKIVLIFLFVFVLCVNGISLTIVPKEELRIGGDDYEEYFFAKAIDVDEKGNIFVLDRKSFSIFKIDNRGKFIKRAGGKGEGPGEFPGTPMYISYSNGKLYISLMYLPRVYIFTDELSFIKTIDLPCTANDIEVLNGNILITTVGTKTSFPVLDIKKDEKYINSLKKHRMPKIFWEQWKRFAIDPKGDGFVVASMFEDKIEKWSVDNKLIWSKYLFTGQGIIYERKKSITGRKRPDIRKSYFYRDIDIDSKGRVYLLSGTVIAKQPGRNIYVLSKDGKLKTVFTLPYFTPFIKLGPSNKLYAWGGEDGEQIIRYKLNIKE